MKLLLKWAMYLVLGFASVLGIGVLMINVYKEEILSAINEKLQETVKGDVKIGDYRVTLLHKFPQLSITLEDIYLHGLEYNKSNKPFLKASKIIFNLQTLKLFANDISIRSVDIEDGDVFIFRTKDGYSNSDVFKTKQTTGAEEGAKLAIVDLKQINLHNVRVMFVDSLKKKSFGVNFIRTENTVSSEEFSTLINIAGNMTFEGIMLNAEKGKLLKNKNTLADLHISLDSSRKNLTIRPSKLIFDRSAIALSGSFVLEDAGNFTLAIESNDLDYKEALTILQDTLAKKLSKYHVEKPVKIQVNLAGVLEPGIKPAVDIAFSFKDSKATAGNIAMDRMTVDGTFMNHMNGDLPNDDSNSRLHFKSMKGLVNRLPVEATVSLSDMKDPLLDLKAVFDVDLKDINDNLDSGKMKLTGGHFVSSFTYSGKLREYLDDSRTEYEGKLIGEATITNGSIIFLTRKINIDKIDAVFGFTEKRFEVRKLNLALNKSDVSVKGVMTDFIPFFVNPKNTGKVKLSIVSPKLDITQLLNEKKAKPSKAAKQKSQKKMGQVLDRLNDELEFNLNFDVKEFVNNNFKATQLKGDLLWANNQFLIKNLRMNFANGQVALNIKVTDLKKKINPLHLDAKLRNVGLKQFFYCFNDFNQSTFRHEHIDGKISLDVNLDAEVNDRLEFLMPNLRGTATFSIEEARLKNFEPMQRLSNFLLKGRDFSDVQFAEITSSVSMRGSKMDVSRMEIESTVLTMFIEGQYDLVESSDLSIQVPLSNLKKRDQDIAPENIGVDKRVGASVFLRVRPDKNGKTTISYDPFKRLRKKKKNGNDA